MGKAGAEVVVVGAGVFGLSIAFGLVRAGRQVVVLDRARPGAGASGGPVGALAPHPPDAWSEKKAFQCDALFGATAWWSAVAAAGGIDPDYARVGRLMPLRTAAERARAKARATAAAAHWPGAAWSVVAPEAAAPWLAPDACPEGAVRETLTARIAPARALAALVRAAEAGGAEVRCGAEVAAAEPGAVLLTDGTRLRAGAVVIAAGIGSGPLLAPLLGPGAVRGVKGQALRLRAALPSGAPVLADDGLWLVPHSDGTVGIGSTSEDSWTLGGPDARLEALLERARALCPLLAGAPVVGRWAGIRPRGRGPEPLVGLVAPGLFMASAGFKTGFALAPPIAELVARMVAGEAVELPPAVATPQRIGPVPHM